MLSTPYQQLDDTSARVNGEQWATQILCNPYYTSLNTIPHKDRLSIFKLLLGPHELKFQFNEWTYNLLKEFTQSAAVMRYLEETCDGLVLS